MQLGIVILTRGYSEVQNVKDICDGICEVVENHIRSWMATGGREIRQWNQEY